jgi:hypothetical protein
VQEAISIVDDHTVGLYRPQALTSVMNEEPYGYLPAATQQGYQPSLSVPSEG